MKVGILFYELKFYKHKKLRSKRNTNRYEG